MKKKNITIDDLALMMKKGFDSVDKRFEQIDKKFELVDKRFDLVDYRMNLIEKRIDKMEERFNQKFDKLMTILDAFLKRMTDNEDEMTMMRNDINRIKKAIKEKLGVELV